MFTNINIRYLIVLISQQIKKIFQSMSESNTENTEMPVDPNVVAAPTNTDQQTTATNTKRKRSGTGKKKNTEKSNENKQIDTGISKRRVARPFAKLPQNILDSRLGKLQKRVNRSKNIYEKSLTFYEKYRREADLRENSPQTTEGQDP